MQLEWVKRDPDRERVLAAAQGADGILREALDASRSLTIDLSPPVLHESGLVGALSWLAARMQEKHQLKVHLLLDSQAEPASEAIRFLLFECARELLFNVAKHAGVPEAHVTLSLTKGDKLTLIISDEGRGFDPALLENRRPGELTFGLFSIQERLAHIGGRMLIETSPEKGTLVTLTAPIGTAETALGDPAQTSGAGDSKIRVRRKANLCRILIVDDHKIMRQGLVGLLQSESGIEVVGEAADGPEAIELAEKLDPDVITMDVNLGKMNGIEATRIILARNSAIRVIGLSMHIDPSVASAMREAGATAYLTKGGPSEDLIAAIRACRGEHAPRIQSV
jgi:CheY-like chemotaxis protein